MKNKINLFLTILLYCIIFLLTICSCNCRNKLQDNEPQYTYTKNIPIETSVTTFAQTTTISATETTVTITLPEYILNINTKKIHYSYCTAVEQMKESNKLVTNNYDEAIENGFEPCEICYP